MDQKVEEDKDGRERGSLLFRENHFALLRRKIIEEPENLQSRISQKINIVSQFEKFQGSLTDFFPLASGFSQAIFLKGDFNCKNKSYFTKREDSDFREAVKSSVKFLVLGKNRGRRLIMGAFCCCFQVDLFESYVNSNSSMTRNCPCINCFLQSFMDLYSSLFNRGGMLPIPSTVETSTVMNSTTALDDSLSSVYHSPPRPLPYDADPRHFRCAKGSSHSGEETEPLRGDTEMSSEALGGGGKRSKSDFEHGSKDVYSKGSPTNEKSKAILGVEITYADSDDEDICPTCLDDYTPENPKIMTKCSHHFHLSCIYEWMERSETCPVCGKVMAFDETS